MTRRIFFDELDAYAQGVNDGAATERERIRPPGGQPMNPVLIPLRKGDMITISWSGELRTVVIDDAHGMWCLRDLTEDENRQLDEQEQRA